MGYLYGDSEPFASGFDFLTALRRFVTAASKALAIAAQTKTIEAGLEKRSAAYLKSLESMNAFFDDIDDVVTDATTRSRAPHITGIYANRILEHINKLASQARGDLAKNLDNEQLAIATQLKNLRKELRDELSNYLLGDPLPVRDWAVSLTGLGEDGAQGQIIQSHPCELTTNFTLDVNTDPGWGRVRRLGDILSGLTLQVGFKKLFLRSSLHPDIMTLDELYISSLELGADSFDLHLRKRLDSAKEAFIILLNPTQNGKPIATIQRLEERAEGVEDTYRCDDAGLNRLGELHEALVRECQPLRNRKKRLLGAQLDGHDLVELDQVVALFDRVSYRLAPVASEVSRHSPNPNELSLKFEHPDGRREELYLRKSELVSMVEPLEPKMRTMFERLCFLPQGSMFPPSVPAMSQLEVPKPFFPPSYLPPSQYPVGIQSIENEEPISELSLSDIPILEPEELSHSQAVAQLGLLEPDPEEQTDS